MLITFCGLNALSLRYQATDIGTGQSVTLKKVILNTALAFCEMIGLLLAALAQLRRCLAGMLLNKTCKVGCAAKV